MSGRVLKRLRQDMQELLDRPVVGVTAAPLRKDLMEWHCNLQHGPTIYHLVLFVPAQYPYRAPRLEVIPRHFPCDNLFTRSGTKGLVLCLDMLDDRSRHYHCQDNKQPGWSPTYTVQSILLSLLGFLGENKPQVSNSQASRYDYLVSRAFKCNDCGHTWATPVPAFLVRTDIPCHGVNLRNHQLVDYISKEIFVAGQDQVWGFALSLGLKEIKSPFEFLTSQSFFDMKEAMDYVHSSLRREVHCFLPVYIPSEFCASVRTQLEATAIEVNEQMNWSTQDSPIQEKVVNLLTNLMQSTVSELAQEWSPLCENIIKGLFILHRLLMWAVETYPDLEDMVNQRIRKFVQKETSRRRDKVPSLSEWLMLLSVSSRFSWRDVNLAYLDELVRRMLFWTVDSDWRLGMPDTPSDYRINKTFYRTSYIRKFVAIFVSFLEVARPQDMTTEEVLRRYDSNMGLPTPEMMEQMVEAAQEVEKVENFQNWFQLLRMDIPSKEELNEALMLAVQFCRDHPSYRPASGAAGWLVVMYQSSSRKRKHAPDSSKSVSEGSDFSDQNNEDSNESSDDTDFR